MKNKPLFIVLTCVLALLLAFIPACAAKTPVAGTVTPLQQVESRVASLEATVANLASRQGGEVTKAELDQLKADLDAIKTANNQPDSELATANAEIAALKARVAVLEAGPSTPTASGGSVTVEIIDQTPLLVYSSSAGMQFTFRVRIANGTGDYKYVAYSMNLICVSGDGKADVVIGSTGLSVFGTQNIAFNTVCFPDTAGGLNTTQILFMPTAKIPVAKGGIVELQHLLVITTTLSEQWEGNLTGVVVSSTW